MINSGRKMKIPRHEFLKNICKIFILNQVLLNIDELFFFKKEIEEIPDKAET